MASNTSHSYLKLLILGIIFFQSYELFGQFPAFNREYRILKKADELYQNKEYSKAISKYKEYTSKYEDSSDIWYKIADSFKELNQPERATLYYNRIIKLDEKANPIVHLSLGQVYMMQSKYEEAREQFLKYNELLEYNDQLAMRYISSIENIDKYFQDSSYFEQQNLPLNSAAADFGASSIDQSFYFLSNRSKNDEYDEAYTSDLFVADINTDTTLESPQKLSGPANTRFGEIGYTIVPGTNEIFICRYEPGKQDDYSLGYSLYKAFIGANNEISKPTKFELEEFKYAIAYPGLSEDGKFMIFASDAPGGFGGWDLYKADYSSSGFSNIRNLGDKVNSAGDELYPFLLNDTILFFATDGHGGLGGFDIYSNNISNTKDYAKNLGYPINSSSNDYAVYFDSGLSGYFSSNREGGMGQDDIYKFTIRQLKLAGEIVDDSNGENLKNVTVSVKRSIGDDEMLALADNGKLVLEAEPGEKLEISVEKEGYETKSFTVNTSNMAFLGSHILQIGKLPVLKMLAEPIAFQLDSTLLVQPKQVSVYFSTQLAASKMPVSAKTLSKKYGGEVEIIEQYDGKYYRYFIGKYDSYFEAKEIWKSLKNQSTYLVAYENNQSIRVMRALKEVHVEPAEARDSEVHDFIDKTEQVSSEIIYYGLDLFRIPAKFNQELENTLKALKDNPDYFLEIAAHTDKRGSDMYNRALSEERAKNLRKYFIDNGIGELRLISHGIGEKQLTKYCVDCTESDHEENRRAELIIRGYKK